MADNRERAKRRTGWGIALTVIWLGAALAYGWFEWCEFLKLQPNTVGDFAAGLAAPLAFLWLFIGYLQQGEELELQRAELALQRVEVARLADETQHQRKAIEANELHARRDTFMRFADLMLSHQAQLAAALLPATGGRGLEMAWIRFNQGDRDAFFGSLIKHGYRENSEATQQQIRTTPEHLLRAKQFIENTETLLKECDKSDPEKVMRSFFEASMMGTAYICLCAMTGHGSQFKTRRPPYRDEDLV